MKRITLITVILGTALAVAPAVQAKVMTDGGTTPTASTKIDGLTPTEYRALVIRSEALNVRYGLGSATTVQPEVTDGWINSVTSSGYSFRPDVLGGNGGASVTPTATGGDSFAWDKVGIGFATLIAAMLLGFASLAATRRRHQPSF